MNGFAANGVIRTHATNSRYFTDDSGNAIYFAGSHTWRAVFPVSKSRSKSKSVQDADDKSFENFLDFLQSHNHNFTRLWTGMSYLTAAQWPWQRNGPGLAHDGKPKFDLTKLDQKYFDTLKKRIRQIENRGMYASVMIFGSHIRFESDYENVAWHSDNHVNAFDFEHSLSFFTPDPAEWQAQQLLIEKFVDTLNEFENIIFEVINEAPYPQSVQWQRKVVTYAKRYEATKPKQHLWGMTPHWKNSNAYLVSGPHDWWSPDSSPVEGYDYREGGPASYSAKPVIVDSDHFDGGLYKTKEVKKGIDRVWKTFTRGNHPILMECYNDSWEGVEYGCENRVNPVFDPIRKALGHTRTYAKRFIDLAETVPSESICSTEYCLVNPGKEYLIYQPVRKEKRGSSRITRGIRKVAKTLNLQPEHRFFSVYVNQGRYAIEWFDPHDASVSEDSIRVDRDGWLEFEKPSHLNETAVLYLKKTATSWPGKEYS